VRVHQECSALVQVVHINTEKIGFVLNPYDPCVANKIINGKISHKQRSVVEHIVALIEKQYGKMVVTYGDKHTYVGIDIEFA
jgi:hypothetical protein